MVYKWLCLVLFFFISCKSSDVPNNVMPVNTMKLVMWDMILADEYVNYTFAKDSTKNTKQESLKLYSKVFDLHKISNEAFQNSYVYYKEHPAKEKVLLDSLQAYGNKMREANYQKVHLTLPMLPIAADTAIKKL